VVQHGSTLGDCVEVIFRSNADAGRMQKYEKLKTNEALRDKQEVRGSNPLLAHIVI
jgi:hypothetical protein